MRVTHFPDLISSLALSILACSSGVTLASGTGICFDYASLGAAMLRSLGIPCQVITGYVSPDDVYHAWNMVYIDGEWISVEISIKPNSWTRVDLTFAASGADRLNQAAS